jgi:uncharacterized protein YjbJ (UPF0337 family)
MLPSLFLKRATAKVDGAELAALFEVAAMNKDVIAGNWKQLKGQAQAKWGDLTDDVFDVAEGDSKYLAGKLQEQYGWDRDRAETEVRDFERTLSS